MLAQLRISPVWRTVEEYFRSFISFVRLESVSPPTRAFLAYGFRAWLAGVLSLYVAFWCQLESPYWAPIAAWIASLPVPGMTLSKSLYRIVGTMIGTVMGVILIALFAQTPELFVLAFALWVAACTLTSNLLRNFRAYASVLAGYTTGIVALPTVQDPDSIFSVAMARGSCTIIGIICVIVVTRLFAPHQARGQVLHKLKSVLGDAARRATFPLVRMTGEDVYALAYKLIADLISLDTEIEYAAAESASFRIHANRARDQVAELFGVISAARAIRSMEDECGVLDLPEHLQRLREEAVMILSSVGEAAAKDELPGILTAMRGLRRKLGEQNPEQCAKTDEEIIKQRLFVDHLNDMFEHFENAILDNMSLEGEWASEPRLHLNFHRDHRQAWINALRAFVAILFAGAFWIVTAWSSGASMMIFVAVVCSLMSTLPRPDVAGLAFFWGTAVASILAFPFVYIVLEKIDGQFVPLAIALAVVMIPGAMLSASPKTNLFGFAFTVNFFAAVGPTNPMTYNVINFLNNTIALNVGIFFGCLAYVVILPVNLQAAHDYVRARIKRAFEILSQHEPRQPPVVWQSRMFDRVNRLYTSAEALGAKRSDWMETGLRALHFGNGILRLRELLETGKLNQDTARIVQSIIDSLDWFTACPRVACVFIRDGITYLRQAAVPEEPEARRTFIRTLGTLEEMDRFFERHPQYLEAK